MLTLRRKSKRLFLILLPVILLLSELRYHVHRFDIRRPSANLDEPFAIPGQCEQHLPAPVSLQNATIFMLARNSELEDAVKAIRSFERHFNQHHHYPYVFANNEPFSDSFQSTMRREVSGPAIFETIPAHMWGYRNGTTRQQEDEALLKMTKMEEANIVHAGSPDYHHMCRFHSGFFYELPAMQSFQWYWRIEPDARFTCDITYDPFNEMIVRQKTYGYVIALWEVGRTAPSLFRTIDDYRIANKIPYGDLYTSMHEPSWAPYILRKHIMSHLPSRNKFGDGWNYCHFWSNFEIANLGFFRSRQYRHLFEHLDATRGFHLERWGDAPVHSLAAGLLLRSQDLHYFEDFGYRHGGLQHCPSDTVGCNCACDPTEDAVPNFCLKRLRESVDAVS